MTNSRRAAASDTSTITTDTGDTTMRPAAALGELTALAAFLAALVGWLSILA